MSLKNFLLFAILASLSFSVIAEDSFTYHYPNGDDLYVIVDSEKGTLTLERESNGHISTHVIHSKGPFIFPQPTSGSKSMWRNKNVSVNLDLSIDKYPKGIFGFIDQSKESGFRTPTFKIDDPAGIYDFHPDSSPPPQAHNSRRASDEPTPEPVRPKTPFTERSIKDPEYRKHLSTLPSRMSDRVIGQPEAIDSMFAAINGRATIPMKKGGTFLFLGTTGVGKTEAAKALAVEHYFDPDAMVTFNMGEMKTSLNDVFGAAAGYIDGDKISPFQQFLDKYPDGGVILFDEIGNMGEDAEKRNMLLKQFYQILDEGRWKNNKGKEYDLSKYTTIFTSNEGQEIFNGLSTDKSRTAAWAANKTPDKLALVLKNNGWPEPIIPRFDGNIILFKPLIEKDRATIAKIFSKGLATIIEKEHGVKVKFADSFFDKVADTFFSHQQGVRQMKIPTITELASLVGKELTLLYENPEQLLKTELFIDLDDISFKNPEGGPLERKVTLKLTTKTPGIADKTVASDLTLKAPVRILERSIKNPVYREHLKTLEPRMNDRVIGQSEAAKSVFKSLRSRATVPTPKAVTLLFMGTTGTGKTELAKAIAAEEFLDPNAFTSFNMGEIKSELSLSNIFGAAKGVEGGKEVPPIMDFIHKHPNGGVILFDEVGNMGKDAEQRNSLLKYFYQMLDEGSIKDRNGKTIDLSKFILTFATNEGEEIFEGLTTDHSRMAAWERNKSPEHLQEILKKSGWPDAVIARLEGNITLFKPLLSKERALIAKNFANGIAKKINEIHEIKVSFTDDFYKKAGDTFFSHTQGIRQLKTATTTEVAGLIGEEILSLYDKPELFSDTNLVIDVNEVREKNAENGQSIRKVQLKLTAKAPGHPDRIIISDLTSKAPEKETVSKRVRLITSVHEAGHAVGNDPDISGLFAKQITNVPEGTSGGHVSIGQLPNARQLTRQSAISRIAMAYAGGVAEEMYFPDQPINSGRSEDLAFARKTAKEVVDGGMGLKGPHLNPTEAAEEIASLLKEGEALARKLLKERWPAVRAVAARLMSKGTLSQMEFEDAVRVTGLKIKEGKIQLGTVKPFVKRNPKCPSYYGSLYSNFKSP
jgi:ATP-dependent Clp protease ATP-binding subunit ClpA